MDYFKMIAITVILIVIAGGCGKPNYDRSIIGTWEWTGDRCDGEGTCKKEIITDEDGKETFTRDGLYLSKRARNDYKLKGAAIYFASGNGEFNTHYADIVSIKSGVMLLRIDTVIRRYELAAGKKK